MINVETIIHSQCPFRSVELGLVAVRCGVAPGQLAFIYLLTSNFADIIRFYENDHFEVQNSK